MGVVALKTAGGGALASSGRSSVPCARTAADALLLVAARPAAVTEPSPTLAELAGATASEWDSRLQLSRWQGTTARLARALAVSGATTRLPPAVDAELQATYLAAMAHNLVLRRELRRVVDALDTENIPVMLLKGAALVPLVHRDPGVRPMDDLDLLVHPGDLDRAGATIRRLGYRSSAEAPAALAPAVPTGAPAAHHVPALVRRDGRVTIELHHRLGDSSSPLDFDPASLWAHATTCTVDGRDSLRPSNEDLLAHVCLHFLVDRARLFSRRALAQLADIAAILDTFGPELDGDALARDAAARGNAAALALALGAASLALDAPGADDLVAALGGPAPTAPAAAELVARRVVRAPSWTTLEQLTSRRPSVRHLLPPNPARWRDDALGPRPPWGPGASAARWLTACAQIVSSPGELAAERRFADRLDRLVFPSGYPNGRASRR